MAWRLGFAALVLAVVGFAVWTVLVVRRDAQLRGQVENTSAWSQRAHVLERATAAWVDQAIDRVLGRPGCIEYDAGDSEIVMVPHFSVAQLDCEPDGLRQAYFTQRSQVQVSLRVYLTDEKTRRVLDWQTLSAQAPASIDTPQAGVVAANQAVQAVLVQLGQFLINRPY